MVDKCASAYFKPVCFTYLGARFVQAMCSFKNSDPKSSFK